MSVSTWVEDFLANKKEREKEDEEILAKFAGKKPSQIKNGRTITFEQTRPARRLASQKNAKRRNSQ